jgi:hypothetical protein
MLAVPVAGLAILAVVLSFGMGSTEKAQANPDTGVEFHIEAAGCSTAGDAKGNCTAADGSTFAVSAFLDSFGPPLTEYSGLNVQLNYAGVSSKDNPDVDSYWPECGFPVAFFNGTDTVVGGCAVGTPPAPQSSTHTGKIYQSDFNCDADGTITLTHGKAETAVVDGALLAHVEDPAGPDVLNIDCVPATSTFTPTPTNTPPAVPAIQKDCDAVTDGIQTLCNEWLERQGSKIPPARCDDSTDVATLTETVGNDGVISTFNQKGEAQDIAAFEFEVRFDWTKVCVNLAAAGPWAGNPDVICTVRDKDSSTLEGIAQIGCVSIGKGVDTDGPILATIEVRPQPELYSQIRPNQDNGQAIQVMNQGCELADEQGHAIPIFSCEDADITFRFLEGDVDGPDCDVDVFDTQQVAFRWGVNKGSLLYNSFMDLEPSGQVKGDGDIDIKDIQFVFGRFGSTCDAPHPAQPPVNPKA